MMDHPFPKAPATFHSVVASLSKALVSVREMLGRPLTSHEIYDAIREVAGTHCWDAMPVPAGIEAARIVWMCAGGGTAGTAKHLLVTPDGHCYVEGAMPSDPIRAADYLSIRRQYLEASPPVDPPPPGSPNSLQAQAAQEARTDRVIEEIARLVSIIRANAPTKH